MSWIKQAIKRKGSFKRKAEKRGLTVRQFIKKVLANPERYDTRTVRQARLAKTLLRMRKK